MLKNFVKTFKIYRFNPELRVNLTMINLKEHVKMWTYGS